MKVFFLTPWWPNRFAPRHGNFVQKHARLVAADHELTVVAIQEDAELTRGEMREYVVTEGGYTLVQYYFGQPPGTLAPTKLWLRQRCWRKAVSKAVQIAGRPDLLHGHILVDGGIFAAIYGRSWNIPHLITEHSSAYYERSYLRGIRSLLGHWATRNATYILPVSNYLMEGMRSVNRLKGNYRVVSNAVNTEVFSPRLPFVPKQPGTTRFLHVSDFNERFKNISGILEGFKKARALHAGAVELHLAGDGDQAVLAERIERAGLTGSVTVSGPHSAPEIADLLSSHDALIHFSHFETQGIAVLEAQCCGLPAIVADNTALRETIVDGKTGLLVESGSTDDLAAKIIYLADHYDEFDRQYAVDRARGSYASEAVAEQLRNLYHESVS